MGAALRERIGAYHMGYLSSGGASVAASPDRAPKVTFLYKVQSGGCDKSFGLNVARMAGVPERVVQRSGLLSHDFEAGGGEASRQQKRRRLESDGTGAAAGAALAELRGGLAGAAFSGRPEEDLQAQARARELLRRLGA